MAATKAPAVGPASLSARISAPFSASGAAPAQNLTRPARPLAPGEFALAFEKLTGVPIASRTVQSYCLAARITATHALGRWRIAPGEVSRFAVTLGLIADPAAPDSSQPEARR